MPERIKLTGENLGVTLSPDVWAETDNQFRVAYKDLMSKENAEEVIKQILDDHEKVERLLKCIVNCKSYTTCDSVQDAVNTGCLEILNYIESGK